MTTRSARIVVFTGLVAVASPARVTAQASQACSVTAGTPRRVELADGRIVSVDVQSMAQSGGSILAIGRHAYVFPRTTTSVTSPVIRDSIIGFEIDRMADLTVPAPACLASGLFPKVSQDGFHIVFATSSDSTASQTGKQDSATIWYALRIAGGRHRSASWCGLAAAGTTSELLEGAGTLSWAFVFADTWENESSGGVVLLRRRRGAWSADTLRTPTTPGVVRLVHGASGDSVVAVFTREYQRGTTSILAQLYLATFTSRWSEASLIAGDGRRALTLPVLPGWAMGFSFMDQLDSWQSETSRIEWLRIGRDGRFVDGPVIATGEKAYPFELIVMDDRHPIWLYHGVPFGTTVELASATDTSVIQLGNIGAPFGDPKPETVAIDDSRVLAHTMRQGSAPDDPMVASWITTLEFRCPRSARR
jgi:hypothetical protein